MPCRHRVVERFKALSIEVTIGMDNGLRVEHDGDASVFVFMQPRWLVAYVPKTPLQPNSVEYREITASCVVVNGRFFTASFERWRTAAASAKPNRAAPWSGRRRLPSEALSSHFLTFPLSLFTLIFFHPDDQTYRKHPYVLCCSPLGFLRIWSLIWLVSLSVFCPAT